ncbi:MAG TPA: nitroreductase family protein [Dehalococcoidia bacterium]|nr:nitroreductase family protein [Dehalococcoidia bacterium]
MTTESHLTMTLGETMFTQRAIRRFRPEPIPDADLQDILEAAIRAPNGGNTQPWHFLVIRDPDLRAKLAELYHEAWWAKRRDQGIMGPQDIPPGKNSMRSAMRLADQIGQAPVIVLLCATSQGPAAAASIIPAAQNLLLAARAFGVGGTITTLHANVDDRVHDLLGIPPEAQVVYCLPLGYPRGTFGTVQRKPLSEVCSYERWGSS